VQLNDLNKREQDYSGSKEEIADLFDEIDITLTERMDELQELMDELEGTKQELGIISGKIEKLRYIIMRLS